mmetsp:Transcript_22224/g.69390  ORF Transcript_22224/g.69390 Transcript_22224/m.69390 type:complete len:331 (-) Transcript_22224:359-1351(-)
MGWDSSITMSPHPRRPRILFLPSAHRHASSASITEPPATSRRTKGGGKMPSLTGGWGSARTASATASAMRCSPGPMAPARGCKSRAPQVRSTGGLLPASPPLGSPSWSSSRTLRTRSAVSSQHGTPLEQMRCGRNSGCSRSDQEVLVTCIQPSGSKLRFRCAPPSSGGGSAEEADGERGSRPLSPCCISTSRTRTFWLAFLLRSSWCLKMMCSWAEPIVFVERSQNTLEAPDRACPVSGSAASRCRETLSSARPTSTTFSAEDLDTERPEAPFECEECLLDVDGEGGLRPARAGDAPAPSSGGAPATAAAGTRSGPSAFEGGSTCPASCC